MIGHALIQIYVRKVSIDVASIDWEQALGFSSDANLLVQQFSDVFSEVIEKHAPLRQIRVSEKYCPWITLI